MGQELQQANKAAATTAEQTGLTPADRTAEREHALRSREIQHGNLLGTAERLNALKDLSDTATPTYNHVGTKRKEYELPQGTVLVGQTRWEGRTTYEITLVKKDGPATDTQLKFQYGADGSFESLERRVYTGNKLYSNDSVREHGRQYETLTTLWAEKQGDKLLKQILPAKN